MYSPEAQNAWFYQILLSKLKFIALHYITQTSQGLWEQRSWLFIGKSRFHSCDSGLASVEVRKQEALFLRKARRLKGNDFVWDPPGRAGINISKRCSCYQRVLWVKGIRLALRETLPGSLPLSNRPKKLWEAENKIKALREALIL